MTDADKHKLYRIVRDRLASGSPGGTWSAVEDAIFAAHNGRPDGLLVTTDNMHLFRQYRNSVSPNPATLVDEALAYAAKREQDEQYVDACEAIEDERVNGRAH